MAQRAEALGYVAATPADVEYVEVPGYFPPQPVVLRSDSVDSTGSTPIDPLYTESLLDWVRHQLATVPNP
jgi:hypothetical protein